MGAITDVVFVKAAEIKIIKRKYPNCVLVKESHTEHPIQQYKLVIADEDEDGYYDFLLDNLIAMCSRSFHRRLSRDKEFRLRVRARVEANLRRVKAAASVDPKREGTPTE